MVGGKAIRRVALATGVIAGVAGAGAYGIDWWRTGRFLESTDDAYLRADSSTVAPKVAGTIATVLVGDNQAVSAGQTLARIDPHDFEIALAQARADVAAAEQSIANLDAQIALQRSLVQQGAAELRSAVAAMAFAEQDNRRYSDLVRTGAGTVQRTQQATAALAEAAALVQRDRAAVLATGQKIDVLRTERGRAQAQLLRTQAALQQAELNLSYTTIVAPVAGTVGARSVRVGQYVQPGTALLAVVPLRHVYVVGNFKETQLTRVRAGQRATVTVDTFPGVALHGRVDSLAPASGLEFALLPPDNATGNFTKIVQRIPVRIALDADSALLGRLRPGMSVAASIDTRPAAAAGGAS